MTTSTTTKKTYNVSIEQPLCNTWEVQAESLEQAIEIAKEKYNNEEFVLTADMTGTDAVMKVQNQDDESEETEWFEF